MAIQALYPFAPHISEELWEQIGGTSSLTYIPYPTVNPDYLIDNTATYVFQINGKLRGKWDLPVDKTKEEILKLALEDARLAKYMEGEIQKVIFVPNKLVNVVVKN